MELKESIWDCFKNCYLWLIRSSKIKKSKSKMKWDQLKMKYSSILGQKSSDKIFYVSNYSYFVVSLLCDWVWVRDYIFCCCSEHELSPSCAVRGILSRVWWATVWGRRIRAIEYTCVRCFSRLWRRDKGWQWVWATSGPLSSRILTPVPANLASSVPE